MPHFIQPTRRTLLFIRYLDAVENLNYFAEGFVLSDQRHHLGFPVVDLLRSLQHFSGTLLWNPNHTIFTCDYDVARLNLDSGALDRCIIRYSRPPSYRARGHHRSRIRRQIEGTQLGDIPKTAIDQHPRHAANLGSRTHQSAQSRDIEPVLYDYDTDLAGFRIVYHRDRMLGA